MPNTIDDQTAHPPTPPNRDRRRPWRRPVVILPTGIRVAGKTVSNPSEAHGIGSTGYGS
jgi:hypothetical protein